MAKSHSLSGVSDRDQRRGLDGSRDMQKRLNLAFVLGMQRGQHRAKPERAGSQQQILDGGVDRGALRDRPLPWTRVAMVDAREDEHGYGGHLLREFRSVSVRLG